MNNGAIRLTKIFNYKLLISSVLILFSIFSHAQILQPVKWNFTKEMKGTDQVELIFTANIDKGWHLYSQFIPDGGPIKTSFTFEPNESYQLIGNVAEGTPVEYYDKSFDMQLKYFGEKAVFRQKIKILKNESFTIKGGVEFMVCDDEKCLPPELVEYSFAFQGT